MPANLENSAVATGLKRSVFSPIPKKGNDKECSNNCTIAVISHASKVMLKILKARLQQYVNHELPDVQAGFRKGRRTRDQTANIHYNIQKNIYFCFTEYNKTIDCGSQQTAENSSRVGNTRPYCLPPEKSVCRSRSKSEPDMEQRTGFSWERRTSRLYVVTLLI